MTDASMIGVPRYERHPNDLYETPAWVTETLLDFFAQVNIRPQAVWEPACGNGAMVRVLETRIKKVHATDKEQDFFKWTAPPPDAEWIITNPPYKLQDEFLDHALAIAPRICLLLRNEFDCAGGRRRFFDKAFRAKIVLTKRPRWIVGSTGAPRHNYAWFIWDKSRFHSRLFHAYGKTFV